MLSGMSTAVWKRGAKNAIVCGVFVALVVAILTLAISASFGKPIRGAVNTAFAAMWFLAFVAFVVGVVHGKYSAGRLLLDCGPHPTRALFWAYGGLLFLFGAIDAISVMSHMANGSGIIRPVCILTFSLFWGIAAIGRLQIRKNGVWLYWDFLKWGRVEEFGWDKTNEFTLILHAKTRIPFLGVSAVPVPSKRKLAIEQILHERLGA